LTISGIAVTGGQAGDFSQTNNCRSSLAGGASCTVNVSFAPTAGGSRSAALSFTDDALNNPQSVALAGTGQDFSVTVASSSQTVSPGGTATYSLNVSPDGGFNQMVQMSCTGAPAQSTCSVSPSSFTLNGSASQPVTVMVTTMQRSSGLPSPGFGPPSGGGYLLIWWFGTLVVSALSLASRHREWCRRWACVLGPVCLVGISMAITACGGGSSGGGTGGIQPGTYNLMVISNFTSGSTTLTHSTPLTLVVKSQ
jgi:hypothetical protein